MSKKIFITGVAGFVGSNIFKRLRAEGHNVLGCDNLAFGSKKNIPSDCYDIMYQGFESIMERGLLDDIDVIVHAATCNIIYAIDEPVKTFETNALNTIKLFGRTKAKIINLSTASVYGNAEVFPTPENAKSDCTNAYSSSKYIAELFLAQRGNYTTLRLSNVYGPNQRSENPYCGVIGRFIESGVANKAMKVIGDGRQTRDFTYVDDVCDAVLLAIEQEAKNTEINIATGVETSVMELCAAIWKVVDKPLKINRIPERKIDGLRRRCLNIEKAKYALGWSPKTNLEQGLIKTIEWFNTQA